MLKLKPARRRCSLLPVLEAFEECAARAPDVEIYFAGLVEDDTGQVWRVQAPVPIEFDLDDLQAFYLRLDEQATASHSRYLHVRLAAARQQRHARPPVALLPRSAGWAAGQHLPEKQDEQAVFWIGCPLQAAAVQGEVLEVLDDLQEIDHAMAALSSSERSASCQGIIEQLTAAVRAGADDASPDDRLRCQAEDIALSLGLSDALDCALRRPANTPAVEQVLSAMGNLHTCEVSGRGSVADLFAPAERCGIYVLHFADGTCYVGQTRDITRRYVQHCKQPVPIERLSFESLSPAALDARERELIAALEQAGFPLCNTVHTDSPPAGCSLDMLMSARDQQHWLDDVWWVDEQGERRDDALLRARYAARYQQFRQLPGSSEVVRVLRAYLLAAVPAFRRSERDLWACLPAAQTHTGDTAAQDCARLSIGGVEGCVAFLAHGRPGFTFYAALSPLASGRALLELFIAYPEIELTADAICPGGEHELHGPYERLLTDPNARITPDCARELAAKLPAFLRRHPSLQISSHYQPSGGSDQASFTVWHPDDALALLRDSAFRRALRVHTLGLMRTPAGHATSSHCPTLADALIGC